MRTQPALALISFQLLLTSCGFNQGLTALEAESITQETFTPAPETGGEPVLTRAKVNINDYPLTKTVCDPFGGVSSNTLDQGIKASLHYRISGMPRMYSSLDYVSFARKSEQKLFFADINVPTRKFENGFSTQANDVLKDDENNRLIEYFGVKFETIFKLSANDEEGDYEFALLSDDGVTLKSITGTKENPVITDIIKSEGDHPTKMGCASKSIRMTYDTALPLELTYYQGPRYHISNVMLMRKADVAGQDVECGKGGNNYFFNENDSQPKQAYKDLIARGWKVVPKENFFIPKAESYNPCIVGTVPVISNFKVNEVITFGVFLSWQTDVFATSQVKLINKATGEVILTNSDNYLRKSHSVQVGGLQSGATYTAQAVSVSEDLGKNLSELIEFTTP